MQRLITIFRTIIVAGFVLAVAGGLADLIFPQLLPAQLSDAYEAHAAEDPEANYIALGLFAVGILIAGIIATIGLLLLKRWARSLALWTSVVSIFAYPVLGPVLYSGYAVMLTELSMMLWGAALAMAYFSDLRAHFEARA